MIYLYITVVYLIIIIPYSDRAYSHRHYYIIIIIIYIHINRLGARYRNNHNCIVPPTMNRKLQYNILIHNRELWAYDVTVACARPTIQ
jgi:hypothetical protein